MNVNIDFMNLNSAQGDVAHAVKNGRMDPGLKRPFLAQNKQGTWGVYCAVYNGGDPKKPESYRTIQVNTTGTLRREEWKTLDEAIVPIAESRLTGVQDLISRGLVYTLGNGMGTTVLETHDVSDAMNAELSMDGVTRSQGDRQEFGSTYLPIPIIHSDYEINERVLTVSRNMGNPLDVTGAERAARKVSEKLESMLYENKTFSYGGGTIYSLTNYPHRNQFTLGTNWTALVDDSTGSVGEKIVAQVLEMKQMSIDNYHYGPWVIHIPTGYEVLLDNDYNSYKNETIRDRILKIAGINGIIVVDKLAANNVLLIQTTTNVVRIVRGMALTNLQWATEGGMVHKFKVMTIQVPQIRSDHNGKNGIVHAA